MGLAGQLLQRVLAGMGPESGSWPTLERLRDALETLSVSGRASGWKVSAARALESLSFSLGDTESRANLGQYDVLRALLRSSTVIELDALDEGTKKFIVPMLLQWVFFYRLQAPDREKLRLCVILEEAHHVAFRDSGRSRETVVGQILRQGREIGLGCVVVDQHPSLLSNAALGNAYASIAFSLRDPSDVGRAAAISGLRDDEKRKLQLPVGHGIVKLQSNWTNPFLVRFDHVNVRKGGVTDAKLGVFDGRNTSPSGSRRPEDPHSDAFGRIPSSDGLSADVARLVHDCVQHPVDGVTERYRRLGWSAEKGGAIVAQAEREGVLRTGMVETGRTRKRALQAHPSSCRLAEPVDGGGKESIEHWYWKQHWAQECREYGFTVVVEAPRKQGRVDVLAERNGERIGIEIGTGRSDIVKNVIRCLQTGFDRVVVVATSQHALGTVERHLGKARLRCDRVSLALRGHGLNALVPTGGQREVAQD